MPSKTGSRLSAFRFARIAVASIAIALLCCGAAPDVREDWSVVKIAGIPVGYVRETWNSPGRDGVLISASEMKMVLNRLGTRVEIELRARYEESGEGKLLKTDYEMRASLFSTKTEAVVKDGVIEFRSEAGGKSYTRSLSYQGDLLGPEGIRRLSAGRLRSPGDRVDFQTFAAEAGAVTKGSRLVLGKEAIRVSGRDVATLKVEEFLEVAGVKSAAWLDERFETVKAEMTTPFGVSEIVRADRGTALAAAEGGELPAEIYERSILRANVRLPKARAIDSLEVKIVQRNPDSGWPEFANPRQTVLSKTKSEMILEVRRAAVPKAAPRPASMTEKNREFLAPNEYIQSDLPEIKAAAARLVGAEPDAYQASLALVRWVSENMTFDLGIALAPAAELFKNRRGTCLGYATLLATLARAAGIPSRVVMGYVYALGMFGGHAWTEVLIGEAWVPLDAAIVAEGTADAARVAFAASSLYDGAAGLTAGAPLRLFGQVDIEVVAYAVAGEDRVVVPEGAKLYEISGETYRNPWIGLEVVKPAGFEFAKADAVWPDPAVIALAGPEGARVEIQELSLLPWKDFGRAAGDLFSRLGLAGTPASRKAGGLSGLAAASSANAALILQDAPAAWLVLAEGAGASALLEKIAGGLSFR